MATFRCVGSNTKPSPASFAGFAENTGLGTHGKSPLSLPLNELCHHAFYILLHAGFPLSKQKPQYNRAVENEVLREHQRVLIDLARYAAETLDLQKFLDDTVVRVSAAVEIDHVKIMRYRPAHGDLLIEAGVGWKPGVVKTATFATDMASPPGRAFQTGQPVHIPDLVDAPNFRVSPVLREHGIVSVLNVPVLVDSAAWGVLEIDSAVLRGFSDDTTMFLVGAAALVSLVIRRVEAQTAQSKAIAARAQEAEKREILLREMQHRVKNNFQMLLALTAFHQQKHSEASSRELASRFGDAIRAMSLAHDQLSATQAGQVVGLLSYLKALAGGIETSVENIVIEVKSDELDVSIEQAVPIGLIVNELTTNSVKHAFDKGGGTIRIELVAGSGPGLATLSVTDNGKGMGDAGRSGSGLKLVRALADQIRAKLEQESSKDGTVTRLIFPQRVS